MLPLHHNIPYLTLMHLFLGDNWWSRLFLSISNIFLQSPLPYLLFSLPTRSKITQKIFTGESKFHRWCGEMVSPIFTGFHWWKFTTLLSFSAWSNPPLSSQALTLSSPLRRFLCGWKNWRDALKSFAANLRSTNFNPRIVELKSGGNPSCKYG